MSYHIGDELPTTITAIDFDPISGERTKVEVKVAYLNKPLVCAVRNSMRHKIVVCHLVTRKWVQKTRVDDASKGNVTGKNHDAHQAETHTTNHNDDPTNPSPVEACSITVEKPTVTPAKPDSLGKSDTIDV